jgi:hypothetical protein
MDLLISNYVYNEIKKKNEPFAETPASAAAPATATTPATAPAPVEDTSAGATVKKAISIVTSIFVSFAAVYLSWSCNTASGVDTGLKVVFAFFAFIFGWAYLIFYLIFRAGRCTPPVPQVVYMQAPPAQAGMAPAPMPAQAGGRSGRGRGGRKCR